MSVEAVDLQIWKFVSATNLLIRGDRRQPTTADGSGKMFTIFFNKPGCGFSLALRTGLSSMESSLIICSIPRVSLREQCYISWTASSKWVAIIHLNLNIGAWYHSQWRIFILANDRAERASHDQWRIQMRGFRFSAGIRASAWRSWVGDGMRMTFVTAIATDVDCISIVINTGFIKWQKTDFDKKAK